MRRNSEHRLYCTGFRTGCFLLILAGLVYAEFNNPSPTTTLNATRGLTQTASGEAMGAGRLTFSLYGSWYQQKNAITNAPNVDAGIYTGNVSFSFGVNPFIDVFATINGFTSQNYDTPSGNGLGAINCGIQGTLPFPDTIPVRLGLQVAIIGGTSANQINGNNADGYNYFETRNNYDFVGKAVQSLVFGTEGLALKFHFNEGLVASIEKDKGLIMLLAGGIQANFHPVFTMGVEMNSRTYTKHISLLYDPLWVTPSVYLRTPWYFNVLLGGDIALSKQRAAPEAMRALERFRIFGGMVFSFDLLAGKRAQTLEKQKKEEAEKAHLKSRADSLAKKEFLLKASADSLARKAREDSVAAALQNQLQRQRADSLSRVADALTQKSRQDSIALAESKRQVELERSKRSDAEKQLLSTGLLLLDAVYFATGKTGISINSKPYLNIIGRMLAKYPKLMLEVGGHTDNVGGVESNVRLSQLRAESVRTYLLSVAPELSGKLSSIGYGMSQPKADNNSAEGRQINRRVELKVLNKEVLREYNP